MKINFSLNIIGAILRLFINYSVFIQGMKKHKSIKIKNHNILYMLYHLHSHFQLQ